MNKKPIYVARPALPPLEEFVNLLEEMWTSRILTNGGQFHKELEASLAIHLGVPFVSLVNNGMVGLQLALMALDLQ
jgi:dTDP-4-amino-4,6-dideoxygalactose transaminase